MLSTNSSTWRAKLNLLATSATFWMLEGIEIAAFRCRAWPPRRATIIVNGLTLRPGIRPSFGPRGQ